MVKIEVEGAKEEVLKAAEGVIRASKPTLIHEIHKAPAPEGVANWLEALVYHWKWLGTDLEFRRHLVTQANF